MKAVFVDELGNHLVKEISAYPPKGTRVFMGYVPLAYVTELILFPSDSLSDEDKGFMGNILEDAELLVKTGTRE